MDVVFHYKTPTLCRVRGAIFYKSTTDTICPYDFNSWPLIQAVNTCEIMTFMNVIITSGSGQWLLTTVIVGPEVAAVI